MGVLLSPEALAAAGLRCGSLRSCSLRSAAANARTSAVLVLRPDSEDVARPKRRTLYAEYNQGILQEAESAAATPGRVGALRCREGVCSSLLAYWQRERANGIREALTPRKRGPRSKRDPLPEENLKQQRQDERLIQDLRKAHHLVEVPKRVAPLSGRPILEQDAEENF